MKKLLSSLVVLVLALAGCGASKNTGDGVITVWAWDQAYNIPMMENAAEIYNETNPDVQIEVVETANDIVNQTMHTAFGSGTTAGLPDIVLIQDRDAPQFLTAYPDAFYALDDVVDYSDFLDYKVKACQYEEKTYCMPFDSGITGLWYREDYIREAGYSDDDMKDLTWDKYFEIAQKVYDKTGKQMITIQNDDLKYIRIMLQSAGTWYDQDFTANEVLKQALEYNKEMFNADWSKSALDWDEYIGSFQSGDVGGVIAGMWIIPSIKMADDQAGNWRMTNTPRMENESSKNVSNDGGSSWYIVNGTGDEEIAADFLNTAFTNLEFNDNNLLNHGALGSYTPSYTSDVFGTADDYFGGQKVYSMLADWAKEIPAVEYGADFPSIEAAVVGEFTKYVDGDEDLDTLLENAKATANQ